MTYYIFSKEDKINKLKKDFISNRNSYSLCSISSNNFNWYNYKDGVYPVKSEDNLDIVNIKNNIISMNLVNEFIRLGLSSGFNLNALQLDKIICVLSWDAIIKEENRYVIKQCALID